MIPRIKSVKPLKGYLLHVIFEDGKDCIYDVNDDIDQIEEYKDLKTICGLFEQVQLDESRTCVFWNDFIDLPSDAIYENSTISHNDNKKRILSMEDKEDFCKCNRSRAITADTESSEWGYWDICCDCGKRIEDGFHYYEHYNGEDHDEIDFD